MFEVKIREYIDKSFNTIEDFCNDKLLLNKRDLAVGDWVLLASFIVEVNKGYCMMTVNDILDINKRYDTDVLREAKDFSIVLIRLKINQITETTCSGIITEGEETVLYDLISEAEEFYNSLFFPKAFTWERNKDDIDEIGLNPSLEELPLFIYNMCKSKPLFMSAGHALLNAITSMLFSKDKEPEATAWFNENKNTMFKLFEKVTEENGNTKH